MSTVNRIEMAVIRTSKLRRLLNLVDDKINDAIHAYDNDHGPTAEALLDEAHEDLGKIRDMI